MRQTLHLEGNKISTLSTKLYYKDSNVPCFRIILEYKGAAETFYQDFESYRDYQINHDHLMQAMHKNIRIKNTFKSFLELKKVS